MEISSAVIIRGCCRLAASDSRRRVYHCSYCLRLDMFEVRTPRDVHNETWNDSDSRGDNIKARLMELNDLKQQGRINENEYDEQKNLSLLEI